MFWDKIAFFYDFFINLYNGKTHKKLLKKISGLIDPKDEILECACGTGIITACLIPRSKSIIATDFSSNMLKIAKKKYAYYPNVRFEKADIFSLNYPDNSFDKVIAANVLHLIKNPDKALDELHRVCKKGGKIILPNYISQTSEQDTSLISKILDKLGADFKRQFDLKGYQRFLYNAGFRNVKYSVAYGRIPCAIAVITKE